jgi:putative ATP-binding cassette transporter
MAPLDVILTWIPTLGRAGASLLRIEGLLPSLDRDAESEKAGPAAPAAPVALCDRIELDGVTYAYHQGQHGGFVLGPIDWTVRPGEIVFLVGGNGSGKTTLVKVLAGLYEPASGAIRLDGQPVPAPHRDGYRQLFSVVFADGHLFQSLQGLELAGQSGRVRCLLERLELEDLVRIEDSSFSTIDLSQGQRKRLALLTALLEDRPVYIFDEWAASQDSRFKQVFYRELLPELKRQGKAVVVISHDEGYFTSADRVVRLDGGLVCAEAAAGNGALAPAGRSS